MADVVPRDGPPPSTGGPIATAVSPGARSGRFTAASWLAASPPQPGDGYLRRDERHGAAGLIAGPETSGQLEHWGKPGTGRYLTVFANAGHTFMRVDGVWFDTAGRAGPYRTRWLTQEPVTRGYVIRHYPGL